MGNCFGAPDIDDDDAPKQYSWDTRADINPDVRGNTGVPPLLGSAARI